MSKAQGQPTDPNLMPYPIEMGTAKYIKEYGDIIAANMAEIALIDKDLAELEADKKRLVEEVISAKRKISMYLKSQKSQTSLNDWME